MDIRIIDISALSQDAIFSILSDIIATKLSIPESGIMLSSNFINDLGADSLDCVEIIMEIELEFNISIPDIEAEELSTVEDCINYLRKKR